MSDHNCPAAHARRRATDRCLICGRFVGHYPIGFCCDTHCSQCACTRCPDFRQPSEKAHDVR